MQSLPQRSTGVIRSTAFFNQIMQLSKMEWNIDFSMNTIFFFFNLTGSMDKVKFHFQNVTEGKISLLHIWSVLCIQIIIFLDMCTDSWEKWKCNLGCICLSYWLHNKFGIKSSAQFFFTDHWFCQYFIYSFCALTNYDCIKFIKI